MAQSRLIAAVLATLAVSAVGTGARAESSAPRLILAASAFAGQNGGIAPRRNLEWDSVAGRWGLKLGVEQHLDRDVQLKDVEPGVYYRLTPRLHIGGGVSLARDQVDNLRLTVPQLPAPRVRLETTLKF